MVNMKTHENTLRKINILNLRTTHLQTKNHLPKLHGIVFHINVQGWKSRWRTLIWGATVRFLVWCINIYSSCTIMTCCSPASMTFWKKHLESFHCFVLASTMSQTSCIPPTWSQNLFCKLPCKHVLYSEAPLADFIDVHWQLFSSSITALWLCLKSRSALPVGLSLHLSSVKGWGVLRVVSNGSENNRTEGNEAWIDGCVEIYNTLYVVYHHFISETISWGSNDLLHLHQLTMYI